jgi:hypothetical protein
MGMLYTIQPDDLEPVEYTHYDCWDDDTIWFDIVRAWEKNLGIGLSKESIDSTIMDLLQQGYDVYNGDEFIEIYKGKYNEI